MTYKTSLPSPIGPITLLSDGKSITGLYMRSEPGEAAGAQQSDSCEPLNAAKEQIDEYFAGTRTDFDLPLSLRGTDFQRRVWQALQTIPFGQTISYAELAQRVGIPKGPRAVGQANGANPVSIIVPCHRVIAADGTLGGYGGGLDRKRALLDLERRTKPE